MKVLIFLFLAVVTQPNIFAAEKNLKYTGELPQIWREGDLFHPFLIHPGTKALISKACVESSSGCQALRAVKKKLKMHFSEAQLAGGKNPSSLLCSIGYKGVVLIFKDAQGNENSFCKFPDLSMVSANDLR